MQWRSLAKQKVDFIFAVIFVDQELGKAKVEVRKVKEFAFY